MTRRKVPDFQYDPPQTPLDILYEDAELCIVNKPAGLLSVPGRSEVHRDSLATRLQAYNEEISVVHRLDMDTSGVMIFACTKSSHRAVSKLFEDKQVEKTYVSLVDGDVQGDEGEIDLPLRCDWPNRPLQMVDHELGKHAFTRWSVMERLDHATRLALMPLTGRSHQLRVHCMAMGHPILGDRFYASTNAISRSPRLCLHAERLTFKHPVTGERLTFSAKADF